ncbi:MAG: efflux RND transporter periplasmic adaptor subunit [Pseudomonadota bacterium]
MNRFYHRKPILAAVGTTAVITTILISAAFYFFLEPGSHVASIPITPDTAAAAAVSAERKIIYWRAPMDPMEIYDKPGKSKMGMDLVPVYSDEIADTGSTKAKRSVVYWRAPMDPMEIYDKPGKSKMGMDLVPVYEDELVGGVDIRIEPRIVQNMGLRTETAEMGPLEHTINTYGRITQDETRTGVVSQKVDGWVETLYVNYTGYSVKKGDPLYELFSPVLVATQEEYLSGIKAFGSNPSSMNRSLVESARQRLLHFDVDEQEIKALEQSKAVKKTMVIRSPFTGIVTHKNAVEGAFMKTGNPVFTLVDLSRVWVEAHIFEYEQNLVALGQTAYMSLSYHPEVSYEGTISYIFPYLQSKTRDIVLRIEFPNPDLALKPDMFARISIRTGMNMTGLRIPSEAIIHAGTQDLVFVDQDGGKFSPRKVTTGISLENGQVQILSGLAAGDRVVTSGQFLLDSESRLKEAIQKMMQPKTATAQPKNDEFFDDMENNDDFFKDMEQDGRS